MFKYNIDELIKLNKPIIKTKYKIFENYIGFKIVFQGKNFEQTYYSDTVSGREDLYLITDDFIFIKE